MIEQRSTVDANADPRLVRISVGVEDLEVGSSIVNMFECVFSLVKLSGPEGRSAPGLPKDCPATRKVVEIRIVYHDVVKCFYTM